MYKTEEGKAEREDIRKGELKKVTASMV